MKKLIIVLLGSLLLASCVNNNLKEDGQFSQSGFVGKFKDISIYWVDAPNGIRLFLGVNESGTLTSTQYSTGGKNPVHIPVIMIDGKPVTKEEAQKIIKGLEEK